MKFEQRANVLSQREVMWFEATALRGMIGQQRNTLGVTAGETAHSLTPKRQGHWRCVFWVDTSKVAVEIQPDARWLSEVEIVAGPQWPSEELADERGRFDDQILPPRFRPFVRYVRAEYYPEYA